jgi:malonate-semialdehyde dehydrogenase (acetylating)/methylmalonate-semialdehyde dehydrogenase
VHGDKAAVDAMPRPPGRRRRSRSSAPRRSPRYIHQRGTANGKRVQALGGAKNHAIVLPDADLDFASDHLVGGRPSAPPGSAAWRSRPRSRSATPATRSSTRSPQGRNGRVGSGRDTDSEMGPVVTPQARDRIVGLIGTGESQGAELAVDGRGLTSPGHENGFCVGPTVDRPGHTEMDVYREEIFGPVLSWSGRRRSTRRSR